MQRIVKIQKANNMKTCTCKYDKQLSLLRFAPYLAYFFNKFNLPNFKGASAEAWKPINHHVCNWEIDFNDRETRLSYFHTNNTWLAESKS